MCKDIVIAVLAGWLISDAPCFIVSTVQEKMGIVLGITSIVFILLLFCEEIYEKVKSYRKRVRRVKKIVENAARIKLWEKQ